MCTNFDSESAAAADCFSLFLTTISIAMLMPPMHRLLRIHLGVGRRSLSQMEEERE